MKNVFVSHVQKQFSDSDVKDYMKSQDVDCLKISTISHKDAVYKSFKICVKEADNDIVLEPDFWGEGIRCRPWISQTS